MIISICLQWKLADVKTDLLSPLGMILSGSGQGILFRIVILMNPVLCSWPEYLYRLSMAQVLLSNAFLPEHCMDLRSCNAF